MRELRDLLEEPIAPFNHVYFRNGRIFTRNSMSFYHNAADDQALTFDVGNQKVLANISITGGIDHLTFYRENHFTEEKPGVWVNKTLAQSSHLKLMLKVNGQLRRLNDKNHNFEIDTLKDCIPRIQHHFDDVDIVEVPFCPIVGDHRLSMLVVGLWIRNLTNHDLHVEFLGPKLFQDKYSDQQNVLINRIGTSKKVLTPNGVNDFGIALIDPDCFRLQEGIKQFKLTETLISTIDYFQNIFGGLQLSTPELTVLVKRAMYQSLLSLAMDRHGNIVGSNWGSFPATSRIWNRDMFYSALPTTMLDSFLCRRVIKWFTEFGVKPPGTKFEGGVTHSASNALAAGMLAGMYYQWTGDTKFFKNHTEVLSKALCVIYKLEMCRPIRRLALCQSKWVSDAYALGDFHTGSNICLWAATSGLAQVCSAVGRKDDSKRLKAISQKIHQDIDSYLVIPGPFGQQWPEGRNMNGNYRHVSMKSYQMPILDQGLVFLDYMLNDDTLDLLMHDGEESDTTMAPVYGFVSNSNLVFQHTMHFTASSANPTYVPEIHGISWGSESGATFPGFISILMAQSQNAEDFENAIMELIKLADLDGSWWWWPYPTHPEYGKVVRNFGCGKCGWGSGMFSCIIITQYLGLTMSNGQLRVNPMPGLKNYSWENAHIGNCYFNLRVEKKSISIQNLGSKELKVCMDGQFYTVSTNQSVTTKGGS